MNKPRKIIFLILILFSSFNLLSQEWKNYPYSPKNSLISFPNDEGRHVEEPTEWWYVFSHLKGESTGNDYTFMLTFFYRDTLIFDGLRIFNVTNETTGEFFPDFKPVNYIKNEENHLEIEANLQDHIETWETKKDNTGNLIPFEYSLHASSKDAVLDIDMNVIKRPLILADSGYLFQGKNNYTYYYSFTGMEMDGFLTINNIKEKVSGTGWFDKQYGNFHPEVGEKYEWFSLQLSNGMDINTWNIFTLDNKLPFDPKYRLFNTYINDSTSRNTSQFNIERQSYFYSPDSSRIYGKKFKLTQGSLDLDLNIVVQNPNCEALFPFPFYEGPIYINGSVGAESVTGKGFAELLHYYEFPIIEFIEPSGYWDYSIPIKWTLKNPDDGRPLNYDLLIKKLGETQYTHIAQNLKDTVFMIDTALLDLNTAYNFMVTASSIDSFLVDTILTNGFFKPNSISNEYEIDNYTLSPIPFAEILTVRTNSDNMKNAIIKLSSMKGETVFHKKIDSKSSVININTSFLNSGFYVITILKNNKLFIKKIFKID